MAHVAPPYRSMLFMPGDRSDFIGSAARSGADAFIVDLEDGVDPAARDRAREALPDAIDGLRRHGDVFVRVSAVFEAMLDDLDAVFAAPGAVGVLLPKVRSAEQVRQLEVLLRERELRAGARPLMVHLVIESCAGLSHASDVLSACDRVTAVTLGTEDVGWELGVDPDAAEADLSWAHGQLVMGARAAGVVPLGLVGGIANYRDLDRFARDARRSYCFGYRGTACIHPAQVPIANQWYLPTDAELTAARRIVGLADEAGSGANGADGRMVDAPIVLRARTLLESASRYAGGSGR